MTSEIRAWADRHEEQFGFRPTPDAALAYDAMGVILAAIDAGARTGPQVRDYLMELGRSRPPYKGITGPVAFDDAGNRVGRYRLAPVDWSRTP
jgi:ABC-type branched-subunit amino acid transport system substrate-binding protein